MFIAYNQGNEQPQRIRHNIKLGLRQYTIAFDIHIVKKVKTNNTNGVR